MHARAWQCTVLYQIQAVFYCSTVILQSDRVTGDNLRIVPGTVTYGVLVKSQYSHSPANSTFVYQGTSTLVSRSIYCILIHVHSSFLFGISYSIFQGFRACYSTQVPGAWGPGMICCSHLATTEMLILEDDYKFKVNGPNLRGSLDPSSSQ